MGELGAFLKIHRVGFDKRDPRRARARLRPVLRAAARGRAAAPGCALHGLRGPVLPRGLPAGQPDPRLERPRLPRQVARGDRPAARHQQLPRVHRPDLPGAVRVGVRAGDQRRPGDDRADRAGDRRARLRGGLDRRPSRPSGAPAGPSRSSAPARPGWPSPPSSTSAATRSPCTSATRAPAGCCASACPTPSSRSRIIDRRVAILEQEGIEFVYDTDVGRDITAEELAGALRRAS